MFPCVDCALKPYCKMYDMKNPPASPCEFYIGPPVGKVCEISDCVHDRIEICSYRVYDLERDGVLTTPEVTDFRYRINAASVYYELREYPRAAAILGAIEFDLGRAERASDCRDSIEYAEIGGEG